VYKSKSIVKFTSPDDWSEVARLELPVRERYFHDCGPILCLDVAAEKPILWAANVGHQKPGDFLWKIADEGKALARVNHKVIRYHKRQSVLAPHTVADRAANAFYLIGGGLKGVLRFDPGTGESRPVPVPEEATRRVGDAAIGPKGMLYLSTGEVIPDGQRPRTRKRHRDMVWRIRRYDGEGKRVPFKGGDYIETVGHHSGFHTAEKCAPFAVAPDGKVYVVEWTSMRGPRCRVNQYGEDGTLLKTGLIADMTKTAGDVAVGGQGRLYVADAVKPKRPGVRRGAEIPPFFSADPRGNFKLWYGTICHFPPGGGSFHHLGKAEAAQATHWGFHHAPVVLRGAKWAFYGASPMTQGANCECVMARIDADGWGRVFFPDSVGHRACVIDCAGNFIVGFGEYGNYDAQGPKSRVPVPEIPLFFPRTVAALDDWTAVVDSHNRRVVQVKLAYRAEETAPVPE
jgi:hypothetical protein